jgi:hypothetical protein
MPHRDSLSPPRLSAGDHDTLRDRARASRAAYLAGQLARLRRAIGRRLAGRNRPEAGISGTRRTA